MKEIIRGIKNSITGGMEEESLQRMEICKGNPVKGIKQCEYFRNSELFGDKCGSCGCPLEFRTRSKKGCPEGKW